MTSEPSDQGTLARPTSELLQAAIRVRQIAVDGTSGELRRALNDVRSAANAIELTLPVDEPIAERIVNGASRLRQAIESRRPAVARQRLKELLDDVHAAERELHQPVRTRSSEGRR